MILLANMASVIAGVFIVFTQTAVGVPLTFPPQGIDVTFSIANFDILVAGPFEPLLAGYPDATEIQIC